MKKILFIPIIFLTLFVSCRKDNIQPEDNTLTPAMARDSLYYIMKEWYYWYKLMPTVTKENYADPYQLLEAMRYKTLDRWSFVADYDEFNAQMLGEFVGHGFRIGVDNSGNARIAMIYDRSPLYLEGVRRGWIVKKINEVEIAPILIANDANAYSSLIGPGTAGITNRFIFQNPDGDEVPIESTKESFQINSVLLYDTLHLSNGLAGHLVFESFIEPSQEDLATAFAFFSTNNVNDLILDLRYNSGGYLYIAQILASYIAGNSYTGTLFAKLQYNDSHKDVNNSLSFITTLYPLTLPRLVVITSRSTASASEAVMNGLNPFIDVVSIGDTTNGKPTGMNGWNVGDKYIMWPITFKMVNKDDEGDYFEGIFPSKLVSDDITHDFDDKDELCLKEAIHYLETGSVSTKGVTAFKRYPQFSEKPEWMNNVFIIEK
ncbi:MAG TPA: S41 family peptidase [Bacteroidales bacterium]|nr:S41 family peptidase [Bacteroidales bacterium]